MRLSIPRLAATWGKFDYNRRGVIEYGISKFELKPFANIVTERVPNWVRRIAWQVPFMTPGLIYAVVTYNFIVTEAYRVSRKNPADFIDENFDED